MFAEKFKVTPDNIPNEGIMFVDHSAQNRSGHLGHAMIEYEPSKVLAFYPDCSAINPDNTGHSGHGFMKYKRSFDGGETWTDPIDEPNSKKSFDETNGDTTMMIEKIVKTNTGRLVVFYLVCDMTKNGHIWEPFKNPKVAYSDDNGESWTEPKELFGLPGRVYDAEYKDGVIYALLHEGEACSFQNNPYRLIVSEDNGESWTERSVVGFDNSKDCLYGAMIFLEDGTLRVYSYDECDEYNLKYIESKDNGLTWGNNRRSYFEKRIRNPQIAYFGDRFIMHGRSGSMGPADKAGHFILYTSKDGINWDEGHYMRMREAGSGSYSENVIVHDKNGNERLLIQTSHAYKGQRTNVILFFIDKK